MILTALQREGSSGKLYSIDIDSSKTVQQDGGIGYLVLVHLKDHWDLGIGDVNELLKSVVF